jgi:hypothetical protein
MNKKWYQKKRYLVGGILILLAFIGVSDAPQSSIQDFDDTPTQQLNTLETFQPEVSPKETFQSVKPQTTQSCNSNYSGCLRSDAGDYDCAGGSGNGPYYTGMVQVIGYDEFGLDGDDDGWGCE